MVVALAVPSSATATLALLKPTSPADPATFSGRGGYSADGLGQTSPGGTVQAQVPAGSTVVRAYLYGTYDSTDPTPAELTIDFDGTSVVLAKISNITAPGVLLTTARAEVTTQVAGKVGSGGATTDFAVNTHPANLDGVALVVIYSNPTLPVTTIAVLDGSASPTGDTATFAFAQPLDKSVPNFTARLSLGIGWSYQGEDGHACNLVPLPPATFAQASKVNVNSQLLTGCAGNYDDGAAADGALITVGGVGDSLDNPTPPDNPPTDDELYDIAPFMNQGDTQLTITSSNPSQDDNLFLAVMQVTASANVTTEICNNEVDDDGDGLTDAADPDCVAPVSLDPTPSVNPDSSRTFTFSSTDPSVTFECSVDAGAFSACTSPHTVPPLAPGGHTFGVRAVNSVGTPGLPASSAFTVSGPPGGGGGSPTGVGGPPAVSPSQALPPPVLGKVVNVVPVSGTVLVRLPGTNKFVKLAAGQQLPVGSIVDARKGVVRLTSAANASGATQTANFYDGIFVIKQGPNGLTDLALTGGSFARCPTVRARRSAFDSRRRRKRSSSATIRKLWGDGSGKFQTTGRYSSAAVRGTIWLVADRCDGTLTKVRKGTVTVRDLVRKRTVIVKAPKSYVARKR
jgi:hypothetical protein